MTTKSVLQSICRLCIYGLVIFASFIAQIGNARHDLFVNTRGQDKKQANTANGSVREKQCNSQEDADSLLSGVGGKLELDPCSDIRFSKTTRKLEINIVVFLTYSKRKLSSARVRLTCEYADPSRLNETADPAMSRATFERLLRKLKRVKDVGSFLKSAGPDLSIGPLTRHSDLYTNAVLEWFEYSCESPDPRLGCGIRRFNVYYTR